MKASELRIGNLIMLNNGEFGTVTAIDELNIQVNNYYPILDLMAINLTPDILLKCGFSETISNRDSGYKQIGKIVNGHDFMFTVECNHMPEFYFDMVGTEVIYLHQLQNLYFALTGDELTFKP